MNAVSWGQSVKVFIEEGISEFCDKADTIYCLKDRTVRAAPCRRGS